ncbi:MAG: GTPase Era [Deltaproteobacteria bacterium RBG_13_52_11]|nr:MAG: GTPase Era [Deltaproteobacteria bacterium RBG_13_52_11]
MENQSSDFRSGVVPIIGRPNVGKSTLLNRLVGEKVAIVSPKPQTTWSRIMGVKTLPSAQILFVDTPGIHDAPSKLNRAMLNAAKGALNDADVILHMVEAPDPFPEGEKVIWGLLQGITTPIILVINKIDLRGGDLVPENPPPFPYTTVMRISALVGTGVDLLEEAIVALLPSGPPYYPEDALTDQTERFMAREIIREKIFLLTHQEIPYSCAVVVEEFKEREDGMTLIRAAINVEKESQKGILIGKGGKKLKEIGSQARMDLEQLLGARVYLDLWVKVAKDWTKKDYALREFGLT